MDTTIPKEIFEKGMSSLFGFEDMSDDERVAFLDRTGAVIIESSVLRFITSESKEDVESFSAFVDAHSADENIIEQLIDAFPTFGEMLVEEIIAFKQEAEAVLSQGVINAPNQK